VADLAVDYDLLTDFEHSLDFVEQSFKGLHDEVHGLDSGSGWGSGDIQDAMHTFADNWSYHRSKLESAIDALSSMVKQTKGSFQDADRQLAAQLAKDSGDTRPATPHGAR
jgi:hypothetical protein